MKKVIIAALFFSYLLVFLPGSATAAEKLTLYTSMKESLIGALRDEFVKQNPDINFDYYSAGAGKLMAKIAAERDLVLQPRNNVLGSILSSLCPR